MGLKKKTIKKSVKVKEKVEKTSIKKESVIPEEFLKYRWFVTSNNSLVIGGKNAEQNEELVKRFMKSHPKYIVMHTKSPGSPFSIILSDNPTEKELEETLIFTASFSRAWREGKKSEVIDIFLMEQIIKKHNMKPGTFGVIGEIDRKKAELKLHLTEQRGYLRAIPQKTHDSMITIVPGKINKEEIAQQIAIKLEIPEQEVLQALPTGNSAIVK